MLTRRATRVAVRPELAHGALPPLPHSLVLEILLCLPPDQRLLAALISRAFRAAVADPTLWRVVSLAPGSGVAEGRVTNALLRAIALVAASSMVELDVSERMDDEVLTYAAVRAAVAANGRTLRRVLLLDKEGVVTSLASVRRLLSRAPAVEALHADVEVSADEAAALLGGAPPFAPLRVRRVLVAGPWAGGGSPAAVVQLAAAAAGHGSLVEMTLDDVPLQAAGALEAVVGAASRLLVLHLHTCGLSPASGPALRRLLLDTRDRRSSALAELCVNNGGDPLLDGASAGAFCAALRACRLRDLRLSDVRLFADPALGDAVVAALAGHATVQTLWLSANRLAGGGGEEEEGGGGAGGGGGGGEGGGVAGRRRAAGASLARLLAANTPALRELSVSGCNLGGAGLRPVLAALGGCTHLRSLDISANGATPLFALAEVLPAVAANESLRELAADYDPELGDQELSVPGLARAEALVAARPPA